MSPPRTAAGQSGTIVLLKEIRDLLRSIDSRLETPPSRKRKKPSLATRQRALVAEALEQLEDPVPVRAVVEMWRELFPDHPGVVMSAKRSAEIRQFYKAFTRIEGGPLVGVRIFFEDYIRANDWLCGRSGKNPRRKIGLMEAILNRAEITEGTFK